ncbi:MAG: RNA polymerase sigma factor [Bacteroidetes bacterium]|nr:RNA polymerase sigma factor [Bacteroidota bacterium]
MDIDQRLIRACIKEDRLAQSQLYRRCFNVLMGVCIRYMKNEEDAVEVLNMGFLKILKNLKKKKTNVPFEALVRRIMINTIIDEYRKNKKRLEAITYTDFEDQSYSSTGIDFNDAAQKFDAEAIEQLIQLLPPVSRQVFNLFAIDGYNHREISKMMNISEGTSKWHVAFARKKLKEMLANALKVVHIFLL